MSDSHIAPGTRESSGIGEDRCPACMGQNLVNTPLPLNATILRCTSCGVAFVPQRELAAVNYDDLYTAGAEYDAHVAEVTTLRAGRPLRLGRAKRAALAATLKRSPRFVLEVGCGVGNFLQAVEAARPDVETYGMDVSARAIALASSHLRAKLHVGPLDASVFPNLKADIAYAWEVLEHVNDVQAFVQQIRSRLSPKGRLFLSTPNYESSWMWQDMPRDPRSRPPVHVSFWTARGLSALLTRAGFRSVIVRRLSLPWGPAIRTGRPLARLRASVDALLRPAQRKTLYVEAMT